MQVVRQKSLQSSCASPSHHCGQELFSYSYLVLRQAWCTMPPRSGVVLRRKLINCKKLYNPDGKGFEQSNIAITSCKGSLCRMAAGLDAVLADFRVGWYCSGGMPFDRLSHILQSCKLFCCPFSSRKLGRLSCHHFGRPDFCLTPRLVSWSASPVCWLDPRRHNQPIASNR